MNLIAAHPRECFAVSILGYDLVEMTGDSGFLTDEDGIRWRRNVRSSGPGIVFLRPKGPYE